MSLSIPLPLTAASLPPATAADGFRSSTGGELILTGSLEGMGLEVRAPRKRGEGASCGGGARGVLGGALPRARAERRLVGEDIARD